MGRLRKLESGAGLVWPATFPWSKDVRAPLETFNVSHRHFGHIHVDLVDLVHEL